METIKFYEIKNDVEILKFNTLENAKKYAKEKIKYSTSSLNELIEIKLEVEEEGYLKETKKRIGCIATWFDLNGYDFDTEEEKENYLSNFDF